MNKGYLKIFSFVYIFLIGLSVIPILFFTTPYIHFNKLPEVIFWVFLAAFTDIKPITTIKHNQITQITMSFAVQLSAVIVLGTAKAVWIIVIATLIVEFISKKPIHKSFFNAGQYGLSILISGYTFFLFKMSPSHVIFNILTDIPAILLSSSVCFIVNLFFVSTVIWLTSGNHFYSIFYSNFKVDFAYYYTLAPISIAMVLIYVPNFPFTLLIMFPPVFAVDQALRRYYNLQQQTLETLKVLADTIDERDRYTFSHSSRVSEYGCKIAQYMNLPANDVIEIEMAGRVHDLGKIAVRDKILRKDSKLDDDEYTQIKQHPLVGYRLLKNLKPYQNCLNYVLYHHERLDGNGYPYKLSGSDIPLGARILAVADSYDAMTSDRVYRKALPMSTAVNDLQKYSGIQFDPDVVKAFINVLKNEYGFMEEKA